jgi:hypothetical protein
MNKQSLFFALALHLAACAPVTPEIASEESQVSVETLVKGVEFALENGHQTIDYQDANHYTADGEFSYSGESWTGSIEGPVHYQWSSDEVQWDIDATLSSFGRAGEDFTGQLDVLVDERFDEDTVQVNLTGSIDSSVNGSLDVDVQIDINWEPGLKGVVFSGTVNDEWVQGQYSKKEEVEDHGDDCKAPIGVDCG